MSSKIVFWLGAAFMAALAAFVVSRADLLLAGTSRAMLFLGGPLVGMALCLAALRLPETARSSLALVLVSAVVATYGFEGYLVIRQLQARAESGRVEGGDTRTKYEVARDLRAAGRIAYPAVFPAYLLQTGFDGKLRSPLVVNGREVLPLGGVAGVETVLCNEAGPYITYVSDRYGFNNPDSAWDRPTRIATVGDSFTQGVCVEPEATYSRLLGALNLGSSGAGPLIELAALKEYLPSRKPAVVLWFFYEGNDLPGDLAIEKKSPLLMAYLDGREQGLSAHPGEADAALRHYIDTLIAAEPNRVETTAGPLQDAISFVGLARLRAALRLPNATGESDYALFARVLDTAKDRVASWSGRLVLVYIPTECGILGGCDRATETLRARVRDIARDVGVELIDLTPILAGYSDRPALFTRRTGGHFGTVGNRVVADTVRARLQADGFNVTGN